MCFSFDYHVVTKLHHNFLLGKTTLGTSSTSDSIFQFLEDCKNGTEPSCTIKADSHIACRAHAVLLPSRAVNSHMPCRVPACSDSAVSFVKVRTAAGNIRTVSPTVEQIVFFVVFCYHSFPRP